MKPARCLVPLELKESRCGNAVNMGDADTARAIFTRFMASKAKTATVVVDVNGATYCFLRDSQTLRDFIASQPQLLIGVYARTATADDIAEDLAAHFEGVAA